MADISSILDMHWLVKRWKKWVKQVNLALENLREWNVYFIIDSRTITSNPGTRGYRIKITLIPILKEIKAWWERK